MTLQPFISTRFFVPSAWVPQAVREIELTVRPIDRNPKRFEEGYEPPAPIAIYDDESYAEEGYIGLPIDWGVRTYGLKPGVTIENRTVLGGVLDMPNRPDPYHPNVLDPEAQKQFMADVLTALADDYAILALAGTGTGKTAVGVNTAGELGRQTLIVVHRTQIAKQWVDAFINMGGMDRKDIAIIQGPKCDFSKPVGIAIVHSLVRREYPPEFYHAYGTVIWDEVQTMGSQSFNRSLGMFPAAYKMALTATKKRPDGAEATYIKYFGQGQVISEAENLPCKVHVLRYTTNLKVWSETGDEHVKFIMRDKTRNNMLGKLAHMLYNRDRQILIVGHSIEHIEMFTRLIVEDFGIPADDIGQFTNEFTDTDGVRRKTSDDYLDWCRASPRIVTATYGMMREGTDIPRLDAGFALSPQKQATQLIGRLRRPLPNKPQPLWYDLVDTRIGQYYGFHHSRLKDYRSDPTIEVVQHGIPEAKNQYA